jgi:hypothetical protein
VVPDRGGRAEEGLGRDPGQLGERLVGERRVGDDLTLVLEPDRAALALERLLDRARMRAAAVVVVLDLEADRDDRPGVLGGIPRAEAVHLLAAGRRLLRQHELERSLDRVLPASLGPWTIVSPGASGTSNSR